MSRLIEKQSTHLVILILISVTCLWRSLNINFVGDDLNHIEGAKESLADTGFHYFRFLAILTLLIEKAVWGYHHAGYHLTNGLMHTANVLLVYWLGMSIVKNRVFAFFAAILFLLHPIHSSSVFWISGRVDALCTTFYLLALLGYSRFSATKSIKYLIFSCSSFLLALFSKEMAISLPLILTAYFLVYESEESQHRWKGAFLSIWPFWVIAILYICFRIAAAGLVVVTGDVHTNIEPLHLLKNLATFIGLLIVPGGHIEISNYLKEHLLLFMTLSIAFFSCFIISFHWIVRHKHLWFFTLFLLLTLLPVMRLVMRWYLYLPSVGFCLAMAFVIWKAIDRQGIVGRMAIIVTTATIFAYAYFLNMELNRWLHSGQLSRKTTHEIAQSIVEDKVQRCLILSVPGEFEETPVLMHGLESLVNYRLKIDFDYQNHVEVLSASLISIRNQQQDYLPVAVKTDMYEFSLSSIDGDSYFVLPKQASITSEKELYHVGYRIQMPAFDVNIIQVNRFGMPNCISVKLLDHTLQVYQLTSSGLVPIQKPID